MRLPAFRRSAGERHQGNVRRNVEALKNATPLLSAAFNESA